MKTKIYSLLSAALLLGAASCTETWQPPVDEAGQLALNTLGIEVSNAEKVISTNGSRAAYDVNDFVVSIRNAQGEIAATYRYGTMPEIVTLPAGTYSVEARSAESPAKAAWDAPYFEGSVKDVKIEPNRITSGVEVTCKFASIKVTIAFSDELKAMLGDDAQVNVVAGDGGQLTFTPAETRAGYFEALAGSNTMVATFSATINGQEFRKEIIFDDVEAGQWRKISFGTQATPSVPEPQGTIDLGNGISIDISYLDDNLTQEGSVGGEDVIATPVRPGVEEPKEPGPVDPIGPDDPIVPDKPTITFSYNGTPVETDSYTDDASKDAYLIVIDSEKGLTNLNVTISSDNSNFIEAVSDLMPLSFDLATISGTDAENLGGIGLPVGDQVKGQKSVNFDISSLVPLLGAFSGTHSFEVNAVDPDSSKKFTLIIKS